MNKAYMLVICLLAASFTGCLADDTSDSIEQDENTEKETIEPVGTHNNETSEYDILIGEIQNLTDEIEELRESMIPGYEIPEQSSITYSTTHCMLNFNDMNISTGTNDYCKFAPYYEFVKDNNVVTLNYVGMWEEDDLIYNSSVNCSDMPVYVGFNNVYDNIFFYAEGYAESIDQWDFIELESEGCESTNGGLDHRLWHTITYTLPEEPKALSFNTQSSGSYSIPLIIPFV